MIKHDLKFESGYSCFLGFGLETAKKQYTEVESTVFISEEIWLDYFYSGYPHAAKRERFDMFFFGDILNHNIEAVQIYQKKKKKHSTPPKM